MKKMNSIALSLARPFLVLGAVAVLALGGGARGAFAQSTTQSGFPYNGLDYASWWYNEYQENPQAQNAAAAMAATGANYTSVLVTQYVQTYEANTIAPSATQTPTDAAVVAAIQSLQNQGIKVFLKPHVDSQDGIWRGDLAPTDVAAWFASYQTFILHYAQIAQQNNVDGLIVGTELKSLSGSAYRSYWAAIIAQIRLVYSGQLAYGANATGAGDEFTSVSFWNLVDLIGVDGYFGLTQQADPTVTQLVAAWSNSPQNGGFNALAALQNLQSSYNKPLIFTELGYESTPGTNEQPWNSNLSAGYDPSEQQDCYQAFFQVFSSQNSWMKGVFWWDWNVSPPAADDTGYSPQNKPAGDVTLVDWYGPATPSFAISPSASSATVIQSGSATETIAVTDIGGFTGSVSLAASGLPSGVSASFAPNPASGSSVLTLTAGATASTGATKVTITGTSGTLTASTTFSLTVNAKPGFTLSASASPVSVTQGSSATDTLTVTGAGGFTGSVTLAASGLPSGVTAAFATNPTTGSSVLTLTASATAATGTSTVTVTGTSGNLTASTTFSLTVSAPPSFTLSPSASSVSVTQGSSSTDTLTVTGAGGFTGSVTLAASGLPSGVTAAFATNPTTGSSVLTLTASATAATGTSTVTVTGTSGNLTASTTIAVTVAPPPGFTLSPSPSSLTLSPGSSGTSAIAVTPVGGFTGNVAVTAVLSSSPAGAVYLPTLSFGSTSPVSISTANGGTATLSIATTGATTAALHSPFQRAVPWLPAAGAMLSCLLLVGIPARRRCWRTLLGLMVLLVFLGFATTACGGGGSASSGGGGGIAGTTPGAYTVTVTAASPGIAAVTTTVSLTVP
jgi:hypothetical protein